MKDTVNISTKVSRAVFDALCALAKRKRLTIYEMLQMVADTFVRYCGGTHEVTPELERAMKIFEGIDGWNNAMNLSASNQKIAEATYYVSSPKKNGMRALHVTCLSDTITQTENVQVILERTLEALLPGRYARLRSLAIDLDCSSILELLDYMIERGEAQVDHLGEPTNDVAIRYKRVPHYAP